MVTWWVGFSLRIVLSVSLRFENGGVAWACVFVEFLLLFLRFGFGAPTHQQFLFMFLLLVSFIYKGCGKYYFVEQSYLNTTKLSLNNIKKHKKVTKMYHNALKIEELTFDAEIEEQEEGEETTESFDDEFNDNEQEEQEEFEYDEDTEEQW